MALALFVVAAGWVASITLGSLFAAFLDFLFVIDVKLNPRTKMRADIHQNLLADMFGENPKKKIGE